MFNILVATYRWLLVHCKEIFMSLILDIAQKNWMPNRYTDRRYMIKPRKVTNSLGIINFIRLPDGSFKLPEGRWVVYSFGVTASYLLNVIDDQIGWTHDPWVRLTDIINKNNSDIVVVTNTGVVLNRDFISFRVLPNNTILMGVLVNEHTTELAKGDLYVRSYTNTSASGSIEVVSSTVDTVEKGLLLTYQFNSRRKNNPSVLVNINNRTYAKIPKLELFDVVEVVDDKYVKEVVVLPLTSLHIYTNKVENARRYLVSYDTIDKTIMNYVDDVDFYLLNRTNNKVCFCPYFKSDDIDQVTHQTFSIDVDLVDSLLNNNLNVKPNSKYDIDLVLHIKRTSNQLLGNEANRLNWLYSLPYNKIISLLKGVVYGMEEWTASSIEQSGTGWMLRRDGWNEEHCLIALGQEALEMNLAYPCLDGNTLIELPPLYNSNSCIYYYKQGVMVGKENHYLGLTHSNTIDHDLVECVSGVYSNVFGVVNTTFMVNGSYRLYKGDLVSGQWTPAIINIDYEIVDGLVISNANELLLISDYSHYYADIQITQTDFIIPFKVNYLVNNVIVEGDYVPYRYDLTIWLNGRLLVANLDYVFKDKKIHLYNKNYFVRENKLSIRMTGLVDGNLIENVESGFIVNGQGLGEGYYNQWLTGCYTLAVDGLFKGVITKELVTNVVNQSMLDSENGKPYQIRRGYIPLKRFTNVDSLDFIVNDKLKRKYYETYMESVYPKVIANTNMINNKYELVSPFMNTILLAIASNLFNIDVNRIYDKQYLDNVLLPYKELLDCDFGYKSNVYDERYITIVASRSNEMSYLNKDMYMCVTEIIKWYMNERIDLGYIGIGE